MIQSPQEIIESGLLELYAIDALAGEELTLVETAIAEHQSVSDEYDRVQATMIAYAEAQAVNPPVHNRARFFEAIELTTPNTGNVSASLPLTPFEDNHVRQTVSELPTTPYNPTELRVETANETERPILNLYPSETTARATGKPMLFAMVASLLLFAVSSLFAFQYYNKWKNAEGQLVALQSERNSLIARTARYTADSSALAILASPSTKSINLTSETAAGFIQKEIAPSSRVKIAWSKENAMALVHVDKLPAPPEGMQYQLWALVGGKPVDAGMLPLTTSQENASAFVPMKDIPQAELFAITLEKAGGVPAPTLDQMFVAGAVN